MDLTPCSEHQKILVDDVENSPGANSYGLTRGFKQALLEDFSGGKKSVASHLTSNDKYSVADRRSSINSEKNETGKFGNSCLSGFP